MASSSRQLGTSLQPDILAPSLSLLLLGPDDSRNTPSASSGKQQQTQKKPRQVGKQQQQPHGPGSNKRGRGTKVRNGAAGPEAAPDVSMQGCDINSLQKKLQKYLQLQQLHLVSLVACVANTLSPVQLATSFVASYPFAPDFLAIAVAASGQLSSKQDQRLEQLQQSILQRDLGICSDVSHPVSSPAAAAAAPTAKKKAAAAETAKSKGSGAGGGTQGGKARKRAGSDTSAASTAAAAAAAAAAVAAAAGGESDNSKQQSPPAALQEGTAEQDKLPLLQTVTKRHVSQRASDLLRHQELCLCDVDELKPLLAPTAVSLEQQHQASLSHLQHVQQQHMMHQQIMQQQVLHEQLLHEQIMQQQQVMQQQEVQQQHMMQQESHLWGQDVQQQEGSHQQQHQQQDQASLLLQQVLSAAQAHWEQAEQQQQSEAMQVDAQHIQVDVSERSNRPLQAGAETAADHMSAHITASVKQRPVLDLSAPQCDIPPPAEQQQQLAQPAAAATLIKQQQQSPMHYPDTGVALQHSQEQQQQQQQQQDLIPPADPQEAPLMQQPCGAVFAALPPQVMQQLPSYTCQAELHCSAMQPYQEHGLDMLQEPWCSVAISAPEQDPFMELDFLQSPAEQQTMFAAAMTLAANLAACPIGGIQQG
jgi:hypothetical protein